MSTLLLVDDDKDVATAVGVLMRRAGITLDHAVDAERAYVLIAATRYDAVLLDLNLTRGQTSGDEGFAILRRLLDTDPDAVVIVITAHSGIRTAVAAMRAGARDFVMKPWRNAELLERIDAAIAHRRRLGAVAELRETPPPDAEPLIGESGEIEQVRDLVRRIGPTRASVLVTGPPGSGRTLVARELHRARSRDDAPLVVVDARLIAGTIDAGTRDDITRAATGTLLLRHVDRLDEPAQVRLAATLPEEARLVGTVEQAGALIPTLHSRLGTIEIAVPPLARRGRDPLLLARHFARRAERRHARPFAGFTPAAEAAILAGPWPDEVRGLGLAVERALLLNDGGTIDAAGLGLGITAPPTAAADVPAAPTLAGAERSLVATALKQHGFNVSHAAAALGLSRAALYRRMAKYGL